VVTFLATALASVVIAWLTLPVESPASRLVNSTQPPPPRAIESPVKNAATTQLKDDALFDLTVEGRLSCGASTALVMVGEETREPSPGGARAYLQGRAGFEELDTLEVRVRRAVVGTALINRFGLRPSSPLRGRRLAFLRGFAVLSLPVTLSPKSSFECEGMDMYEAAVSVNGAHVWTGRQPLNKAKWQRGGHFVLALEELHKILPLGG
jgi:hypothetical protein